jgi:hypothetical protein
MIYYSPTGGQLWTVTVFLMDEWLGAQVDVDHEWSMLEVSQGNARITQQLPDGG